MYLTRMRTVEVMDRKYDRVSKATRSIETIIYRSDTHRRKRPASMLFNQTSVFTTVQHGVPLTFHSVSSDGNFEAVVEAGDYFGRGRPNDAYIGRAIAICENKARAKIRDSGVNLAMLFAEYRETCDTYNRLGRTVIGLLRRKPPRPGRPPRRTPLLDKGWRKTGQAASGYLTWKFGVKPLTVDMYDAMVELQTSSKTWTPVRKVVTSHNEYHDEKVRRVKLRYTDNLITEYRTGAARVTCRYLVRYNESPVVYALANHGLTNPAALLWELIPFSFVVDWWIGVGEVLESLDNILLVSSTTGHTSVTVNEQQIVAGTMIYRYLDKRRRAGALSLTSVPVYSSKTTASRIATTLALFRGLRR